MKNADALVAKDIMTAPIICVNADEGLKECEQRLVDARVTGLAVVESGRLVGIITRSDYVRVPILLKTYDDYVSSRLHESGMQQQDRDDIHVFRSQLETLRVNDVMTSNVVTCLENTPVKEIASKMLTHHIHRIVVVADQDRPVGIVVSLDLVRLLERQ